MTYEELEHALEHFDEQHLLGFWHAQPASEFYFLVSTGENLDGTATYATITPRAYWDRIGYLLDTDQSLDHILPDWLHEAGESEWESERSIEETIAALLRLGMVPNDRLHMPGSNTPPEDPPPLPPSVDRGSTRSLYDRLDDDLFEEDS